MGECEGRHSEKQVKMAGQKSRKGGREARAKEDKAEKEKKRR